MAENPKQTQAQHPPSTQLQPPQNAKIGNFDQYPNEAPVPFQPPPGQPVKDDQKPYGNSHAAKHIPIKPVAVTFVLITLAVLLVSGYSWYSKQNQSSSQHTNRANSLSNPTVNNTANPSASTGVGAESVPSGTDNPTQTINSNPGLKSSVDYCKNNPLTC